MRAVLYTFVLIASAQASVEIPTVLVGNSGNAPDPLTGRGTVTYEYRIGITEVTNAQYAAFLNAVAAVDTNGLYNPDMAGQFGGITRTGSSGTYSYATVPGRADRPVSRVSFWDAARFANWMHNGQPVGLQDATTTEDGAYTLTAEGIAANTIARNNGWHWAVTSRDEWYKAAYHQPASDGGDSDDYWLYPSQSNISASGNYAGAQGDVSPVGSYSSNYYGTYDMAGNLWEWNEHMINDLVLRHREWRGGSFDGDDGLPTLRSTEARAYRADFESLDCGFRLVRVAPICDLVVLEHPQSTTIYRGEAARFEVSAGSSGALTYEWLRGGQPLSDGVAVTGVSTSQLTIFPVAMGDAGAYSVRIADGCAVAMSQEAQLTVEEPCQGDADRDGVVAFGDITAVLANWGADYPPPSGTGPGDATLDGEVDFVDLTSVLANWGEQCP